MAVWTASLIGPGGMVSSFNAEGACDTMPKAMFDWLIETGLPSMKTDFNSLADPSGEAHSRLFDAVLSNQGAFNCVADLWQLDVVVVE